MYFYQTTGKKGKPVPDSHQSPGGAKSFCQAEARKNPGKTVVLTNDKGDQVGAFHYDKGTLNTVMGMITGKITQTFDVDGGVDL